MFEQSACDKMFQCEVIQTDVAGMLWVMSHESGFLAVELECHPHISAVLAEEGLLPLEWSFG